MTAAKDTQTLGFQTEARQLLKLMIHSLYSNKEIFLRELVSNASDAADKLRFEALARQELLEQDPELSIVITADPEAGTLTIADNGIGMSRQEVIDHLGTIARSGTAEFLSRLSGDQRKDAQLIGQFGVGFYSAFIVASKVDVYTRRAGLPPEEGVHWQSTGEDEFSIAPWHGERRGTTVVLTLREGEEEFADDWRLRAIVKKYSDHIALPVMMPVQAEGEEADGEDSAPALETVNSAQALWTRPRGELEDDDYKAFYKHIAHDFEDPLTWTHNRVEGRLEYISLLYIPRRAPLDLWHREASRGLKLYVQRTFIMDEADQFLPLYLRFVRGVIDSSDLPLNVSRELLQNNPQVDSLRSALTRRVLDMLKRLSQDQPEQYAEFWSQFGQVLKEGPAEDHGNRERIAELLRFATTHTREREQSQSLKDYVERMPEGQKAIYYVAADSHLAAANSPHLEVFRKKGLEVLLLSDQVDEWLMGHLGEFDGKPFQDVARGELDLGELEDEQEREERRNLDEGHEPLLERSKQSLEGQVETVRMTHRLTHSPACLVVGEHDLGSQMRKLLEAAGQEVPAGRPILELNPDHPLVQRLAGETEQGRFDDLLAVLFSQAQLAEGGQLEDPAAYVQRLNRLLLELSGG